MSQTPRQFTPDYSSHPGRILKSTLDFLNMTQKELAVRIDVTEKHISSIMQGKNSITADLAVKLERALGDSASFWLGLQRNFDEVQARLRMNEASKQALDAKKKILAKFDYADLAKIGWVPKTQKTDEKIIFLEQFFGVTNLPSVANIHPVAFRKTKAYEASTTSIYAWLRQGQKLSSTIDVANLDISKLKTVAASLNRHSTESPDAFIPAVQKKLADCGVALMVMRHPIKSRINGSTQWLRNKVLVQISFRNKYADIFWFTLLHELAHVVLHGQSTFVDCDESENNEIENEANVKARNWLIKPETYKALANAPQMSRTMIQAVADKDGIHPGIIVGRLQHEKVIPHSAYNDLRLRYGWNE